MRTSLLILCLLLIASSTPATPPPQNTYFTILAGGGGTRLWPLSRDHKPKQFLEVGSNLNLIEQSIARLENYPAFESTHLVLATALNIENQMEALLTGLNLNVHKAIISDPSRRDTGPAILLNILEALKQNPDAVIAFIPADPFIPTAQSAVFAQALEHALTHVHSNPDKIVLLGKTPTFPATGYGYIEMGNDTGKLSTVASFKEKPNLETAQGFLDSGKYLWNMGIFVANARFFADLFKRYAPEIYDPVSDFIQTRNPADYNRAKAISVDFAVMQPASLEQHLRVLPVTFDWEDVGDVKTYIEKHAPYLSASAQGPLVYQHPDAKGNLVLAPKDKLVAVVGLSGVCVVDTGDALLVVPCDQSQKVKDVVKALSNDPTLKLFVD